MKKLTLLHICAKIDMLCVKYWKEVVQMIKRGIAVLMVLVCIFTAFCFTGCGKTEDPLFGEVMIIGPDGNKLLDSEIYISKENATAADAVIQACSEMRFAFTYENGMFDNFDGVASTMKDGWILYSDKKLAEVGAGELLLENFFYLEFRYVNYDETFFSQN